MLVGRSQELGVLNASYQNMLAGQGSVLFLTGEAGLGKTTLVHEWWRTLEPPSGIYTEAECSAPIGGIDVGAMEALQPWADVVANIQSQQEEGEKVALPLHSQPQSETKPKRDKKKLTRDVLQSWAMAIPVVGGAAHAVMETHRLVQEQRDANPGQAKIDMKKLIHDAAPAWAWALPVVGEAVHAAIETGQMIHKHLNDTDVNLNATNQQQVFQQYVNLLTKIAEQTPLIVLLDDMHWADSSSVNLLFYLSRQIASKRILVLATYRPIDVLAANDGKGHPILSVKNEILRNSAGSELVLGTLGITAIRELLDGMFPGATVDEKFAKWLLSISNGNSLFITQFVQTLLEDRHLNEHGIFDGQYDNIAIPNSVMAVIEERTRRLDEETKQLLSYATTEGEEFTSYVLAQLTDMKPLPLLNELKKAQRIGMIEPRGQSRAYANQMTSIFGFSHALFHKTLYDGLMPEERDILHRQCFDILKTEWDRIAGLPDRPLSLSSKLLTHAEKCGEIDAAAEVALAAAQTAWLSFAESEAMEMLAHALRLSDLNPKQLLPLRIDAKLVQSDIHTLRGKYIDALESVNTARDNAISIHDDSRRASAFYRIANIHRLCAEYDEALGYYSQSHLIRESLGDLIGTASSLSGIGRVHGARGEYDEALKHHTEALAIRESIGDKSGIAGSLNNIGLMHHHRGEYDEALEYYGKSLTIKESLGDRAGIASSLLNTGGVYYYLKVYDKARDYFEKSMVMLESIGDRASVASSLNNIGSAYLSLEQFDLALDYFTKSLHIRESINDRNGIVVSLLNLGIANRKMNEQVPAREFLMRAREMSEQLHLKYWLGMSMCELGLLGIMESQIFSGEERQTRINDSIARSSEGITIFREIQSGQADEYEQEIEKMLTAI